MSADEKTSIWKKEITFGRKPKEPAEKPPKGQRPLPAPVAPAKPESVAELLRPVSDEPTAFEPVAPPIGAAPTAPPRSQPPPSEPEPPPMPPVSPSAATGKPAAGATFAPLPPVSPSTPPAEPSPAPTPNEAPAPEREAVDAAGRLDQSGESASPVPEPPAAEPGRERQRKPSRRERKAAKKAADRLAREQKEQEKERARRTRKEQRAQRSDASRHKRLVGLKIGASQVAAAQLVNTGAPHLVRMARMPLDRGVVVGGELREPEELTAALKRFFKKNKLPRHAVRLGISNNRVAVRTFDIAGIDDPKQLANAIRFRAQETMPIPLEEAVLDYRIIGESMAENGVVTRRVLLVVAHRELVERYAAACRKAGLKLVGIDLEAFALLRALGDPDAASGRDDDAALVCVSIGHDRSTLAVSDGRICEFTRVLAWGGSALDVAVARALDLTPAEAEPVKRALSLVATAETAGLDPRRAAGARRAMNSELQAFARELVSSLRFYQEQPGSLGIGEILVTGGSAQCGGLVEELERLIGVTVRVGDPLGRVKLPRRLRMNHNGRTGSLAVAVGLGIED